MDLDRLERSNTGGNFLSLMFLLGRSDTLLLDEFNSERAVISVILEYFVLPCFKNIRNIQQSRIDELRSCLFEF